MRAEVFSVPKVSEGGMGQKRAIELLKENGIKGERAHSPFVGESGVRVVGSEEEIEKAETLLFGE